MSKQPVYFSPQIFCAIFLYFVINSILEFNKKNFDYPERKKNLLLFSKVDAGIASFLKSTVFNTSQRETYHSQNFQNGGMCRGKFLEYVQKKENCHLQELK